MSHGLPRRLNHNGLGAYLFPRYARSARPHSRLGFWLRDLLVASTRLE